MVARDKCAEVEFELACVAAKTRRGFVRITSVMSRGSSRWPVRGARSREGEIFLQGCYPGAWTL